MFQWLKNLLSKLFKPQPQPLPAPIKVEPPPADPQPPASTGPKFPSREDVLKITLDLIEGRKLPRLGIAYKYLRESQGPNRSPEIDRLIKNQGGSLGESWCQYGQQELLDQLCFELGVKRTSVEIPEGGGTQDVFERAPKRYKQTSPGPLCWVTWRVINSWKGHVGLALSPANAEGNFSTFEFNTEAKGEGEIVRDGQGAEYCSRDVTGFFGYEVRGYIDIYQALADAWEKDNQPASPEPLDRFTPDTNLLLKALTVTGKFESSKGTNFSALTGDADKQGLSVGALQWCFGQGSLQSKILRRFIEKHGSIDALNIFPKGIDHLANAKISECLAWVRAKMLTGPGGDLRPEWEVAWLNFLSRPEVIDLQWLAIGEVGRSAKKMMINELGLNSTRAFCWCFDIVTHNGGLESAQIPPVTITAKDVEQVIETMHLSQYGAKDTERNKAYWRGLLSSLSQESLRLLVLSHRRALTAKPAWYSDTLNRKGTIAVGSGWVHGELVQIPSLT